MHKRTVPRIGAWASRLLGPPGPPSLSFTHLTMKSIVIFSTVIAIVAAQRETFSFAPGASRTDEPSATGTGSSGPIETGNACGQIAGLVDEGETIIDAEVGSYI